MGKSGTAFTQADSINYGYNDKSEVTSAVAQNQVTYNYGFNFDAVGNRITSTSSETGTAVQTSYTANSLNQYSLINDGNAKTPAYDFDGNMTSMPADSGSWALSWDGENRLRTAVKGTTTLECKYDYLSRRVEKRVMDGGTETSKERFVYDDLLQVEQLNALDNNSVEKKRIWGLGGKIITDIISNSTFYAVGDENKNTTEYLNSSGVVQGHFEYSPFGKITVASGNNPDVFDFRFSSEYFDQEAGLVYYNFRYYNPELGRWLSRDPIEELGGVNLYNFCEGGPVNFFDLLGLKNCCVDCGKLKKQLASLMLAMKQDAQALKDVSDAIDEFAWWRAGIGTVGAIASGGGALQATEKAGVSAASKMSKMLNSANRSLDKGWKDYASKGASKQTIAKITQAQKHLLKVQDTIARHRNAGINGAVKGAVIDEAVGTGIEEFAVSPATELAAEKSKGYLNEDGYAGMYFDALNDGEKTISKLEDTANKDLNGTYNQNLSKYNELRDIYGENCQ
jgi:RHS repeat-associated protein